MMNATSVKSSMLQLPMSAKEKARSAGYFRKVCSKNFLLKPLGSTNTFAIKGRLTKILPQIQKPFYETQDFDFSRPLCYYAHSGPICRTGQKISSRIHRQIKLSSSVFYNFIEAPTILIDTFRNFRPLGNFRQLIRFLRDGVNN